MRRVYVVGGGPAGMMAAIAAARAGARVTLYEKNEKLGKKLYITGKGRCNLTNSCAVEDFFGQVPHGGKFLYSAMYSFTNADTVSFFEELGLPLKEERGGRIFPASDKSSDVIRALENEVRRLGVEVRLRENIKDIAEIPKNEDGETRIIVATGGVSYPSTGSTGDGYIFAANTGHRVVAAKPALVPLIIEENICKELEGLSLRNVNARVTELGGGEKPKSKKQRTVFDEQGEMLFTDKGVSGPLMLTASSLVTKGLAEGKAYRLSLDLKPALSKEQLDSRILRDWSENPNKAFRNSLSKLLPAKLIPVMVELSGIDPHVQVNSITREERDRLVNLFKDLALTITGTEDFNHAIITSGGVDVRDIDPKTMESKLCKGLYFAGEVLDVDAFTGGYNIQIALSTGWAAGCAAAM